MKINGFKIQLALKQLTARRELLLGQFPDSLFKFEGETKEHPDKIAERYLTIEQQIARIQTAQGRYNARVEVKIPAISATQKAAEQSMSLQEVVKFIGGVNRVERLWKRQVKPKETPRWATSEARKERSKDNLYAADVFTKQELIDRTLQMTRFQAAIREAIQMGNSTEVDTEEIGLSPDDLVS